MWSLFKLDNPIGSVVIEILSFRQKTVLLYIIGFGLPMDIPFLLDKILMKYDDIKMMFLS